MIRRYRRLIALTLIPIVLNALAASVSAPAFADESDSVRMSAALSDTGTDKPASAPDTDHFGKNCNHGCHATCHLVGQVCGTGARSIAASAPGIPSLPPFTFPVSLSDMPFRPPRTSSLA